MDRERALKMLEDIDEATGVINGIELNEWEAEFIESITDQIDGGRTPTPKQAESLEQIWGKV